MTHRADVDTQRAYARLAGFMYLFVLASSIAGLIVTSSVGAGLGFAERSAQIVASKSLFRVGLVLALVGSLSTVLLAVALYVAVRPVDRNLALVGLLFRVCESAIGATGCQQVVAVRRRRLGPALGRTVVVSAPCDVSSWVTMKDLTIPEA